MMALVGVAWLSLAVLVLVPLHTHRQTMTTVHRVLLVCLSISICRMALLRFGIYWEVDALRVAAGSTWANVASILLLDVAVVVNIRARRHV